MRDIRRSRHCRRIFFRYLRQRDKEKESARQKYRKNRNLQTNKASPKFDKFNSSISATIVVTIFLGIISIFIHYYLTIVLFSALLLEILIFVVGSVYYGQKEKIEELKSEQISTTRTIFTKPVPKIEPTFQSNSTIVIGKESSISIEIAKTEPSIVLEPFDMMTGVQFKDLLEKHFKKNGYSVNRISPRINSIDFLIEKEGKTIAIATKRTFDLIQRSYISNVNESAKMYENITRIMIITTSMYFMPQARQLAEENGIILWDREILKSRLGGLK